MTRRDIAVWAIALIAAAAGTAVCVAAGARLGSGLTLGVGLVIAIVLGVLAFDITRK